MATIGAPSATASSAGHRVGASHVGGAAASRVATYSRRHRRSAATAAAAREQQQRRSSAVGGDVAQGVRLPAAEIRRRRGGRGASVARASAEAAAEADPAAGVALYNPKSYDALVKDAARSVQYALADNHTRLEVDFPPLPSSVSGYEGASEDYIDANIQLALAMVRRLRESDADLSVKLVFPDTVEKRVAARKFRSALELVEGVKLGSLDEAGGSPNFFAQLKSAFDLDFDFEAKETAEKWSSTAPANLYIILNASTAELPSVERYTESLPETAAVLLFNLELETLRADLGLFGFPPKDVHYRFLSRFLPVFFLRMRDYSKSVAVAPFILNYSGALLRLYPGPWQVMLKQGNGSYACVAEGPTRFTLGETKEELLRSLGLQEEEGSTMEFLRRGYKTKTWWEEETEAEVSANWRT